MYTKEENPMLIGFLLCIQYLITVRVIKQVFQLVKKQETKRNKIKRRLREIFRLNNNDIKKGYNLVFIPRAQISKAEYKDIENSMINLFKKAKILENKRDER